MRYYINFDKLVNQLVPYYIGGRKLILYLQALLSPLRKINDDFVDYAKETRIEASMTSQIFKFEWYLNRKFQKYFADGGKISIHSSGSLGVPIYQEIAKVSPEDEVLLFKSEETATRQLVLYRCDEQTDSSNISFIVTTPRINTSLVSEQKYLAMLKYVVDKYRLANKTYIIKYE